MARRLPSDELKALAKRAREDITTFNPTTEALKAIYQAAEEVGKSWSGGWLGYHARVYIENLQPRQPGDYFDIQWGGDPMLGDSRGGPWVEYRHEAVVDQIMENAGRPSLEAIDVASDTLEASFNRIRDEALGVLAASAKADNFVDTARERIAAMKARHSAREFVAGLVGKKQFMSADRRALSEGFVTPPHIQVQAMVFEHSSCSTACGNLADELERVVTYLDAKERHGGEGKGTVRDAQTGRSVKAETRMRSILFADVAGWSKLSPDSISNYATIALPEIAKLLVEADHKNTWGDALVATFDSALKAARVALDIQHFFMKATRGDGVEPGLAIRIALHAGEVIIAPNPITGAPDIFGDAVHLAARLEPIVPVGHVLCTRTFADLLGEVRGLGPRAWLLPGKHDLAKEYGSIEVAVVGLNNAPQPLAALPAR